jgi:hypothetical protein
MPRPKTTVPVREFRFTLNQIEALKQTLDTALPNVPEAQLPFITAVLGKLNSDKIPYRRAY